LVFTREYADIFAKFAIAQGNERFTARDIRGLFPHQLLPNLSRRGWILDTGIKMQVRQNDGKKILITVWQISAKGKEAAPYLLKRQEGLDCPNPVL